MHFRAFGILAAVAAAWLSLGSPRADAAPGYQLLRLDGKYVKWGRPVLGSGAAVTYAFARQAMAFPDARNCQRLAAPDALLARSRLSRAELERAFVDAAGFWQAVAGIRFAQVDEPAEADIVVGAQAEPRGWAFSNVAPAAAAATPQVAPIRRSLICLNPLRTWKSGFDGDLTVYDLKHVAAHELGHAIGLDHPGPSGALMAYRYDEAVVGLQAGDVAGVVALYGRRRAPTAQEDGKLAGPLATSERDVPILSQLGSTHQVSDK